jgi:hypothetical protein
MRFVRYCVTAFLFLALGFGAWAEDYKLANGNTLSGEIASADEDGMVVRLEIGGFSQRTPWVSFSQETLRKLRENPELAEFVDIFIEIPMEEWIAQQKKREIVVREVANRVERPEPAPSLIGAFNGLMGYLMLVVLVVANLYAAYEVALFRGHNVGLVCGLSFILPVVGQVLFLSVPSAGGHHAVEEEVPAEDLAGSSLSAPLAGGAAPAGGGGGLSLASMEKAGGASAQSQPQVFQRSDHNFDRRFFETKFPGFFRMVLGPAERDMVLVFRTPKQEFVGKRISRISSSELHLVLLAGGEKSIGFSEMTSVVLRHKDAKG